MRFIVRREGKFSPFFSFFLNSQICFLSSKLLEVMQLSEVNTTLEKSLQETIKQIKLIELENIYNPFFRNFVIKTFGNISNQFEQIKAIWNYAIKNFKYEDDPGDELLTAPKWLLQTKKGDCDDFALFVKSCLTVLNIPCFYLLAGKTFEGFTHIAVITQDGIIIDPTNDKFNFLSNEYINRHIV